MSAARDRIAEALHRADWGDVVWSREKVMGETGRAFELADVVLEVLPELLTTDEMTATVAEWSGLPVGQSRAVLLAVARKLGEP